MTGGMSRMNYSFLLDFIIIVFLFLCTLVGMKKGFTNRVFSFICSLLVILGAYIFMVPASVVVKSYLNQHFLSTNAQMIFEFIPKIYHVITFVVLFFVFTLIKWLIVLIFNHTIEKWIQGWGLTHFVDGCLGAILNALKGTFVVYIVLCALSLPFVQGGSTIVQQSLIGDALFEMIPSIRDPILNMNHLLESKPWQSLSSLQNFSLSSLQNYPLSSIQSSVEAALDSGVISKDDITNLCEEYKDEIVQSEEIVVSQERKNEIKELLDLPGIPEDIKEIVLDKINVE